MPVETIATYTQKEIVAFVNNREITFPVVVKSGTSYTKGTVMGIVPTTGKYTTYDKTADAAAGSATAKTGGNTGNGTFGTIAVQDAYTVTETVTVTFTDATHFTVSGSVSGSLGTGVCGTEFKGPNSTSYKVKFTITAGNTAFVEGDAFTIALTAAGANVAEGILATDTDATSADQTALLYGGGCFTVAELTGLDADAVTSMGGKYIKNGTVLVI